MKITMLNHKIVSSIPAGDTFDQQMKQGLIEGRLIDPWEDNF